jgi:isopenicillin N synthase-like dioxygenase
MGLAFPKNLVERLKVDGYMLLPLTQAASEVVAATFDAAYPFFRAPLEEKTSNSLPQDMGYRPIGVEYSQSPERPDLAESFAASARTSAAIEELRSPSARVLYERMLAVIDVFEPMAEELTVWLADAISGRPLGHNLRGAFRRWSRLQLNYSRPADATSPLINDPHEDGDLLTIACATGPGLELQKAGGEFIPITTATNEVLVMPGEIAWLLSGGQIRPLWHRVRREPGCGERMSLLFFGDIDPSVCDPWVPNSVNSGVDIGARVLTSVTRFGLKGFIQE